MTGTAFSLWLSLRVAVLASAVVLPIGVLVADVQARRRYPGHGLVTTLVLYAAKRLVWSGVKH